MRRLAAIAAGVALATLLARDGRAAPQHLGGDTVTAHVFEEFAHNDFSPDTAVVGNSVEFSVDFNGTASMSLDLDATGFTLIYDNQYPTGSFNEGLTELVISDLDFVPAASVAGVIVTDSNWAAGSFADIDFGPDSITIQFDQNLEIPHTTTWTATFAITMPEPAIGTRALAVLGVFASLPRRRR